MVDDRKPGHTQGDERPVGHPDALDGLKTFYGATIGSRTETDGERRIMKALLIVAHGSRRPEGNKEIMDLAERLAAQAGDRFDRVAGAFIQFTTPLLGDRIAELAREGVTHITLFPYFIASGSHVSKDIPESVEQARKDHPGLEFTVMPHLGASRRIPALILDELHG